MLGNKESSMESTHSNDRVQKLIVLQSHTQTNRQHSSKKINFKQFWLPACEFPKANFSGKIFKTIPVAKAKKKLKHEQKSVKQTKCRKTES